MRFELPEALARYVARKGSVCINGVSLTVNDVEANRFGVNIIPHTLAQTTLGGLRPGQAVNLEVDLIARYLERLLEKIGRASCRERVLQYVYTSVGAVYLKKKKKHINLWKPK